FTHLDDATLYTASYYSTTTRDREDVFDRHQEGLVDGADRLRDVAVQGLNQLLHSSGTQTVVVTAFQSHQRGTHDDRGVVAGEVVLAQQLTHFHFYQLQQLSVVYHVGLHQEGLVDGADRLRDVAVQGLNQLLHSSGTQTVVVTAFQSHQRGTHDDRGVVAGEVVLAQQLTHFHFYQLQQLSVVYHVGLVQ